MKTTQRGYRVRLINFDGILLDGVFPTITAAIERARKTGFEVAVDSEDGYVVATWSPIVGARFDANGR